MSFPSIFLFHIYLLLPKLDFLDGAVNEGRLRSHDSLYNNILTLQLVEVDIAFLYDGFKKTVQAVISVNQSTHGHVSSHLPAAALISLSLSCCPLATL